MYHFYRAKATAAHLRPLIPQIASAVFVTSSKEPVSPLTRAINIAPSRAETNSLAFPLAVAEWAPAFSKTRISQSSFARKNSRTPALLMTLRILVGLHLYLPGRRFARGSGPSASRTTVG